MAHEERIKNAFAKVKEDTEGIKNELAFALKRIAKLEDALTKTAVESMYDMTNAKSKKKSSKKLVL